MFILEKPYVSEFLVDTVIQNDWAVLHNEAIEEAAIEEGAFNLCSAEDAVNFYQKQEYPLIYSNSEHAAAWVIEKLPQSNLCSYIKLFKDKFEFREMLKELYPDFYYTSADLDSLQSMKPEEIKFPIVLKPAVGFLSLGVHTVKDAAEWKTVIGDIKKEMSYASSIYSEDVINSSKYLIEEMIDGEEYAVDAYYDRNGDAVILNIYQHPLSDEKDVRDRIYTMSAQIMVRYMAKFAQLIREIGELRNIKNLAIHLELKVNSEGKIIPIEINPMRFAGWCAADIAKYAWGINVYKCFHDQIRPNWNDILSNASKEIFYFSLAEIPQNIPADKIQGFAYGNYLSNFSKVLEVRRIDYTKHPLFAVIFGSTTDEDEIRRILNLKTANYVIT